MKRRIGLVCMLVMCMMLCACQTESTQESQETVVVGIAYPQEQMDADTHFIHGIELAKTHINSAGGVMGLPVSCVIRDDNNDATLARQIAQSFVKSNIHYVIGHWSSAVCGVVEETYETNQTIMITPAATASSLFSGENDYLFRTIADTLVYAEALGDFLSNKGYQNVAIYYGNDTYGIAFSQAVETALRHRGINVVDRVNTLSVAGLESITDRWHAFGCDAVVVAAVMPEAAEAIKLIREMPTAYPIFGAENFDRLSLLEALEGDVSNLYQAMYSPSQLSALFLSDYKATYGHEPDTFAIAGYEAMTLLCYSMNAIQSTDSEQVAAYLKTIVDYKGIAGNLTFDSATNDFGGYYLSVAPMR